MSAAYNDGTIPYGSRVLTINTVTYIANNIRISRPTKVIRRTNELDEPTGSVGIKDFVTGSAELQLATSSTAEPPQGQTFAVTFDATIGSETFLIKDVDRPEEKGSDKKVNITFVKKYN
jgi:hypothetical protein